jgi:hypothetical protein
MSISTNSFAHRRKLFYDARTVRLREFGNPLVTFRE